MKAIFYLFFIIVLQNGYSQKKQKISNPIDTRVSKIKSAVVGDIICYSQNWTHSEIKKGFLFIKDSDEIKTNFEMITICYIERKVGNKIQVRVGSIESNVSEKYTTPTYKDIPLYVGDIIWVDPIKDKNWIICE